MSYDPFLASIRTSCLFIYSAFRFGVAVLHTATTVLIIVNARRMREGQFVFDLVPAHDARATN